MQTTGRMSTARQPTWAARIPGKQQQPSRQRPRRRQRTQVAPGWLGLLPCHLPAQLVTLPQMQITAEASTASVSVVSHFALRHAVGCCACCAMQDGECPCCSLADLIVQTPEGELCLYAGAQPPPLGHSRDSQGSLGPPQPTPQQHMSAGNLGAPPPDSRRPDGDAAALAAQLAAAGDSALKLQQILANLPMVRPTPIARLAPLLISSLHPTAMIGP